jgi:hypothetical protein
VPIHGAANAIEHFQRGPWEPCAILTDVSPALLGQREGGHIGGQCVQSAATCLLVVLGLDQWTAQTCVIHHTPATSGDRAAWVFNNAYMLVAAGTQSLTAHLVGQLALQPVPLLPYFNRHCTAAMEVRLVLCA